VGARKDIEPLHHHLGRIGVELAVRLPAALGQLPGDHVLGMEERIDHLRPQRDLLLAQAIEQRFQGMGGVRDVGEPERPRATLDRVGRAEDGIELLGIRI
jgi:hypothetical protein